MINKKTFINFIRTPHIIWGVLISFLFSNILYFIIEPNDDLVNHLDFTLIFLTLFTGITIYLILFVVINAVLSYIKDKKLFNKGLSYYFVFTNLVVIITMLVLLTVESLLHESIIELKLIQIDENQFNIKTYFIVNIIVATIINSFYSVFYFFNKWMDEERISKELLIQTHELKELSLQSELQMYKMQLDPHFLFNSFSMLTYLIDTDTDKAQLYLENLSNVYRYILTNSKKDVVKIEMELELIEAYQELLKIRHQNNIVLQVDLSEVTQQKWIAPITLQLLIENAIKHNKHSKEKPLYILINDVENDFITVKNNIQKIDVSNHSTAVGLDNIKQRYSILSDIKPIILEDEKEFIVKIPLLNE